MYLKWALVALANGGPVLASPLSVHEWGTFTALQDEDGNSIGGINSDDEALPSFTHAVSEFLIIKPDEKPPIYYQGAPRCLSTVTMRLETPVIYFHPQPNFRGSIDTKVKFRSGWITEYFPDATVTGVIEPAPGGGERFSRLGADTASTIEWKDAKLPAVGTGPKTDSPVWLRPRDVDAASVQVGRETEKFLFYRGVAHLDAPIRVTRGRESMKFHGRFEAALFPHEVPIRNMWVVDIKENGDTAFEATGPLTVHSGPKPFLVRSQFQADQYGRDRLKDLKGSMQQVLVEDGLHADEAKALLDTWDVSYFKSWGLRVFFLLPQKWTDHILPMEISVEAIVKRVMVGRIELVTPQHRALLQKLAQEPVPTAPWIRSELIPGKTGPEAVRETGEYPPLYGRLGRFRNALVLDEQRHRPSKSLRAFIEVNGLEATSGTDH